MDKKTIGLGLGLIAGIGVIIFLATYAIPRVLVTLTKAAPATAVDITRSYVIGNKILAAADGKDKVVVNIFLIDKDGKGVEGKVADLQGLESLEAKSQLSDNTGMITFEGTSSEAKQYKLVGIYNGVEMPRGVTVTFR